MSLTFVVSLAVSAILGVIGGAAFRWTFPEQAWNIFVATFLWTLMSAAGSAIARCSLERVRRGQWRRGLWIANIQTFPLTTAFLITSAIVSAGKIFVPELLPILYGCTLVVALTAAVLGVLASPYRK
ncbi:MAG: hypothetical protein RMK84_16700 [Oscillochloridaceae bacterium]|nr:hypothetical protein [Chloroflexaceae bacterium]MDW8391764.1 hypothetical protein [Oscillochloridaceae bacterium]